MKTNPPPADDIMHGTLASVDQVKSTLIDLAIKFGPRLLTAILIMVVGVMVSRWVVRWLERGLARIELEPPARMLISRIFFALLLGLFVILALQNLGVELLPLIAGLGIAGAGIALAMQGVLSNIVAGLTIIFTKPYRVGEYISLLGVEGRVTNISLFNTVLSHSDQSYVVVPNRKVVGEILHNYGTMRQLQLQVGVGYESDLNEALAAVQEVLKENRRVLTDPVPLVNTSVLADSSIMIAVKPWVQVRDYNPAIGEINKALVEKLRARKISIPFPQREVRILGEARQENAD
jgi:small conductance mechanosensitive channel